MNEPTSRESNAPQQRLASHFAARSLNKLLCRLKTAGDSGVPFEDRSLVGTIARTGINVGPLLGWQPGPPEQQALSDAQELCADMLNPSSWRNLPAKHAQLCIVLKTLPSPQNEVLLRLAEAAIPVPQAPSSTPLPTAASRPRAAFVPYAGRATAPSATPLPSRPAATGAWINPAEAHEWMAGGNVLTIYLDETWPLKSPVGVLAGVVWRGEEPNFRDLDFAQQHLRKLPPEIFHARATECLDALRSAHVRAFPFIFRFEPPAGVGARMAYGNMVYESLLLLLGWILPPPAAGKPVRVRVVCEAIGEYVDGTDRTDGFGSVLEHHARRFPEQYGNWRLESLRWLQKVENGSLTLNQKKEQGYLGYADLLCYLTLGDEAGRAAVLAREFGLAAMPTFLTFSSDLARQLERLHFDSALDAAWALDFLAGNPHSPLAKAAVARLAAMIGENQAAREALWGELDRRYLAKERNLRALDRQFSVVLLICGPFGTEASWRLQLMDSAVRLQRANHFGDPADLFPLELTYHDLRQRAMENGGADLVAHVDLNRAVRAADRFDPEEACWIILQLLEAEPQLSLLYRAKAHSSLGQYYSLQGDYSSARAEFDQALDLLAKADLPEAERQSEWDQTAIYRAFNAIDAGDGQAVALVEEVLVRAQLGSLHEAIPKLAGGVDLRHQFRHHLVLRLLDAKAELQPQRIVYFNAFKDETGDCHPWELIALYRALLTMDLDTPRAADKRFGQALSIALAPPHGPTLRMIGAMIGTAAWVATGQPEYQKISREILAGTYYDKAVPPLVDVLPSTAEKVAVLIAMLNDAPNFEQVDRVLEVLAFNYR